MKIIVQFSDATQTTIISYFGSWQNETIYPNQAEIETNDQRYIDFYESMPEFVQELLPSPT